MVFVADSTPDRPVFYGCKNTWWTFKSDDPGAVASAIGLKDANPVTEKLAYPLRVIRGCLSAHHSAGG